jgi:hypothetical protein
MKINSQNYYQFANQVGIDKLLPGLKKMHEVIDKVTKGGEDWSMYNTYRDRFDKQFEALEMFIDETNKPKAENIQTQPQHKSEHKTKELKPYKTHQPVKAGGGGSKRNKKFKKEKRFEKPKVNGKGVELISPEVSFIRRFVSLHNKTKTKEQIVGFIRALQKAIIERRLRRAAKHSKVIEEIQKQLVSVYRKMGSEMTFRFDDKDLNRYYKIAGAEVVMPSVRFIKAYYTMQGREMTKHKVSNLLNRIQKAIKNKVLVTADKYYKHIRIIINSLEEFLKQQGKKALNISESQLNGLEGVLNDCGCQELQGFEPTKILNGKSLDEKNVSKDENVLTVQEVRNKKFSFVPITEPWLSLLGKFCLPTSFFISGLGGSGKSTWALLFSQYMASLGFKILYIAKDQIGTPAFTDLLNRLDIVAGDNFKITGDLISINPKDFHLVVIDNKDDLSMKPKNFEELKIKYPEQTFLLLSRATKAGDFTGSGEWRNIVDVMLLSDNGIIRTGQDKNRWGGKGEMRVF